MEVNKNGTNVRVSAPNAAATPNPLMQTAAQLGQGQIPRNDQLQSTINATQIALEEAKHQTPLSAKGQVLVEDVKDLLASGSRLIAEKNADEKLQRLAMDAGSAGSHTRGNLQGTGISNTVGRGDAALMRGHARSILDNGRSIGMFAVRSGQFRDLLLEVLNVFQSLIQSTQQQIAQQPTNNMQPTSVASGLANTTVVPQQQKDALWDRFVALLNQLGSRPEYYTGVDHIFQVIDHMSAKGQTIKNQTGGVDALPTSEYDRVWQDLKLVFEEFAGVGTMDEFERRNWVLFHAMKEDPEARMWMTNFRSFILETIRNPTTLNDSTRTQYGRGLFDQGRYLFQGKYRPFFQDVFDQMKLILTNIKNDSVTQDFSAKMQKLGADFAFDASGKPDLFVIQESLGQMRMVLVPIMSSALSNLPIPKIEGSNAKYDFSVEGLLLHVGDLLPEFVNFRTKSDTRMSVQRLASNKSSVKVVMEVDRIRANFKDIRFFYRRKRMPKIEDHGIADVDLSQGTGVSLRIVWKLKSSPNQPMVVRLLKVKCNIDRLTITVRNAKHNILDKLATKLFAGTIKKQIANAIVNNIIKTLTPMSAKLNDLFRRKPLTGLTERANDAMKTRMMSEEPGLLSRAKDTIVSGAQQAKSALHSGSSTGSIGAPSTTGILVEEVPVASFEQMTFIEKPRDSWAFEWYSPSPTDTLEAVEVLPATSSLDSKLGDASRVSSDPFVSI